MAQQLSNGSVGHNGIAVLTGVTQDQFLEYIDKHRELSRAIAEASQERKDFLGKVKTEFGKPGYRAFLSSLKASDQPGEDREAEDLAFRRMMQWLSKPVGTQASFDDLQEASAVVNIGLLKQIDHEGESAGNGGLRRERNPYTPETEHSRRWDAAWLKGQAQIAASMAPEQPKRRGRPPGSGKLQRAERELASAANAPADEGKEQPPPLTERVH